MLRVAREGESGRPWLLCSLSGQRLPCGPSHTRSQVRNKNVCHLLPCGWDGMGPRTVGARYMGFAQAVEKGMGGT